MKYINRCIITLKPKKPFVDWVITLDGVEVPETWDFEGGAYLLDEHDTEEAVNANIQNNAISMFENELSAWTEDRTRWPEERDAQILEQWFSIHTAVACFDLSKNALLRADIETF